MCCLEVKIDRPDRKLNNNNDFLYLVLIATRDMKLIHEEVESVRSSSLHSYRLRWKKKKPKPTKLDKIKDKVCIAC